MPVCDSENRLVGIVTVDDVMDIIQEEAEEDAHKHDRDDRDSELIFPGKGGAREQVFHVGKDARRLIHIENR